MEGEPIEWGPPLTDGGVAILNYPTAEVELLDDPLMLVIYSVPLLGPEPFDWEHGARFEMRMYLRGLRRHLTLQRGTRAELKIGEHVVRRGRVARTDRYGRHDLVIIRWPELIVPS